VLEETEEVAVLEAGVELEVDEADQVLKVDAPPSETLCLPDLELLPLQLLQRHATPHPFFPVRLRLLEVPDQLAEVEFASED
jgi:hypothetical protein